MKIRFIFQDSVVEKEFTTELETLVEIVDAFYRYEEYLVAIEDENGEYINPIDAENELKELAWYEHADDAISYECEEM